MTITSAGKGAYRMAAPSQFVSSRGQLDDLQRQLTTQQRSTTYSGLGIDRRISLDINAKLSAIESWQSGIERAQVHLKLQAQAVESIATLTSSIRTDISTSSYLPMAGGRTGPQVLAEDRLSQVVDLLNIDANGLYLFSGRDTDKKTAESGKVILYGDGNGRAGLQQLMNERAAADGVTVLSAPMTVPTGRLIVEPAATNVVTLSRDAVNDAYGFKIESMQFGTGAPTLPTGTPPSVSLTLATQPQPGDTVYVTLTLPDATKRTIALSANATTGERFSIGADTNQTAASLRGALTDAIARETQTSLKAASTVWTAEDFFNENPPHRIDPPYTAAPTGRAADTVIWYHGDARDPAQARTTTSVQVDKTQTLATGTQANEGAITRSLSQLAVLALSTFPQGGAYSEASYYAMTERVRDNLGYQGVQHPSEILTQLGGAQSALKQADERHEATKSYLQTSVAKIEQVDTAEVAVQILAVQNSLEASYRVTSILAELSLTKYL
jgi:flagellar hook-associated protein 3 FlgL